MKKPQSLLFIEHSALINTCYHSNHPKLNGRAPQYVMQAQVRSYSIKPCSYLRLIYVIVLWHILIKYILQFCIHKCKIKVGENMRKFVSAISYFQL